MTHRVMAAWLAVASQSGEVPELHVGETIEEELTSADSVVHTETLHRNYTDAPVVCKSYAISVREPGIYTIELRSYLFDAYLVLRSETGGSLCEDDDGAIGSHARITWRLEGAPTSYRIEACALHAERGPFELYLEPGEARELSGEEALAAERADLERSLEVREQLLGAEHPETATSLSYLAIFLRGQSEFEAARSLLERALAIDEKSFGSEHPSTAVTLNNLATVLQDLGNYGEAQPLFERAVAIWEKTLGPHHPQTAGGLNNLAALLKDKGDYSDAQPLFEQALAISERTLGPEDFQTAQCLNNLALILEYQGNHSAARPMFERALAIWEKALGPEHPQTALALDNMACLLREQGDYAAARPLAERALAAYEAAYGPEHPDVAVSLVNLAILLHAQGDSRRARPLFERALAIRERTFGPEHPHTATSLDKLAHLLLAQGDLQAARPLCERALSIREEKLGPEHPLTADSLKDLAGLLRDQGDYQAARPLYERALAILEKALGADSQSTAVVLISQADLLMDEGNYESARPLCERALRIQEAALGPEHPETALGLHCLAGNLQARGEYREARRLLERAVAIRERALGPQHPQTATSLNDLAGVLYELGDYVTAQPLCERAVAIAESACGPEHTETAKGLNNLAGILRGQGRYEASEQLFERARCIYESVLGPEHPFTARSQYNLAFLLYDLGLPSRSSELVRSALRSSLAHAWHVLWSMSEKERLLFLEAGQYCLKLFVSSTTGVRPTEPSPRDYELVVAWRGLVSHSMLSGRESLYAQASPTAASLMDDLRRVQTRISKLLYASEVPDPSRQEHEIRALRQQRNDLEVELQRLTRAIGERSVTTTELQQSLERGSAILDFMEHPLYDPAELDGDRLVRKGRWTEDHLMVWIVRGDRDLVHLDLGPSAPIEHAVKLWLEEVVMSDATSREGSDVGGQLRAFLWNPIAVHLDGIERVLVRPDSYLGTLPFEVLPLEEGRFLIEEKSLVYLQSPTELVRLGKGRTEACSSLLAVGGVDFARRSELEDATHASGPAARQARRDEPRGHVEHTWRTPPYSDDEAESVRRLHDASFAGGETLLLTNAAPTEERLKRELPRHAVVHLATHGFFHPEGTVSMWDRAREDAQRIEFGGLELEARALVGDLPGLLSGLVCAGANAPAPEGRDDGLLTAEEVLWLDLSKVELVVLSACETALGERRSGEGMIGLRRAFGLAGAKTVVSSLWSVEDRSTAELMRSFYENLWQKGQGRAEALRNAQLEMLERNRAVEGDALPSSWGAFVLSGEWR